MMRPVLLLLAGALACAACGDSPTSPTDETATDTRQTEMFSGVIQVKGTKFYSYRVTTAGTVTAMFGSLTTGTGAATGHSIELGMGIPAGTGCALGQAVTVPPSLVPQLSHEAAAGIYCVSIADVEGLPASMNFAIRIVHP